jgi:hypothetical protein
MNLVSEANHSNVTIKRGLCMYVLSGMSAEKKIRVFFGWTSFVRYMLRLYSALLSDEFKPARWWKIA